MFGNKNGTSKTSGAVGGKSRAMNAAKRERETLIPPPMKPAKTAKPISLHPSDCYDERFTEGTEFAERILAIKPSKPPQRRSA